MRTNSKMDIVYTKTTAVTPVTLKEEETVIVTKVVLDFDDCLFPSSLYRRHNLLRYHESDCEEPITAGRHKFHELEPEFARLKQDIDLVIFKLMQLYDKSNFCVLSTGDYHWIESTLKDYGYLLSAYNTEIISTQQWHKTHPEQQHEFSVSNSLQSKQFLMRHLRSQWQKQLQRQYEGRTVQIRVISIGDSFFEFLACCDIGFDFVNRIKLLEEPSVAQLTQLWRQMLVLTKADIYDQNVVFMNASEFYRLDAPRLAVLHRQCVARLWHKENLVRQSLHEIITRENEEHYQVQQPDLDNGACTHTKIVKREVHSIEQQIQLMYDSLQNQEPQWHAHANQTTPVHVHENKTRQHVNVRNNNAQLQTAQNIYHQFGQQMTPVYMYTGQQRMAHDYQLHQQMLFYSQQQWMMTQHEHNINIPSCTRDISGNTSQLHMDMRHLNLTPSVTATTLSNT